VIAQETRFPLVLTGKSDTSGRPSCIMTSANSESRSVELLPRDVVQHIAAGEVIDGLCAVVRELVENSLDARASTLTVDIDCDSRSITVQDDGAGISVEGGLLRVAMCHTTSKIRTVQDLANLNSLGFRGQGLWAVAMHAGQLVVASRTLGADAGTRISFKDDGTVAENSVCHVAMAAGTIVQALALHRLDFTSAALRECRNWLVHTALCHLGTVFVLKSRGKVVWSSARWIGMAQSDAFASSLGKNVFEDFRSVTMHDDDVGSVDVVVGLPSRVHFSSGSRILVAVNGRCVDLPDVTSMVRNMFRTLLPRRRYPAVYVHLKVTKHGACNWNLHPMKRTMRIGSRSTPCDAAGLVERACIRALRYENSTVDVGESPAPVNIPSLLASMMTKPGFVRNPEAKEDQMRGVFDMRPVGQALNTYIIAEYNASILLVEQHVAHERILFERLSEGWRTNFVPLLDEIALPDRICNDDEKLFMLSSLGFDIDFREGESGVRASVRSVPDALIAIVGIEGIGDALLTLSSAASGKANTVDEAVAMISCRYAVKNGVPLSMKHMQAILNQLMSCQSPHTCPHGRPIFLELGQRDLASVFRRPWISTGRAQNRGKRSQGSVREILDGL
jgi:DNA mismatch repair protein MutL